MPIDSRAMARLLLRNLCAASGDRTAIHNEDAHVARRPVTLCKSLQGSACAGNTGQQSMGLNLEVSGSRSQLLPN